MQIGVRQSAAPALFTPAHIWSGTIAVVRAYTLGSHYVIQKRHLPITRVVPGSCSVFATFPLGHRCLPGPARGIQLWGLLYNTSRCGPIGSVHTETASRRLLALQMNHSVWSVSETSDMQVVRPALRLHNTISSLRLRAVEAFVALPLLKSKVYTWPRSAVSIKSDRRVTFGHPARPASSHKL